MRGGDDQLSRRRLPRGKRAPLAGRVAVPVGAASAPTPNPPANAIPGGAPPTPRGDSPGDTPPAAEPTAETL